MSNPFRAPSAAEILAAAEKRASGVSEEISSKPKRARAPPPAAAPAAAAPKIRAETAENFVAKKKEIFWLQMNLNVKKAEIEKIEKTKEFRASAISAANSLLGEDRLRLNAFVSVNDARAAGAQTKADELRNENTRLTNLGKNLKARLVELDLEIAELESKKDYSLKLGAFLKKVKHTEFLEPREMTDELSSLEEQNLQLIKNVQLRQEQLEEQESQLAAARGEIGANLEISSAANNAKKASIEAVREECRKFESAKALRQSDQSNAGTLRGLQAEVLQVNAKGGLDSENRGQDTLQMLTNIEKLVESLIHKINKCDDVLPGLSIKLEKAKEKERRKRLRAQRISEDKARSDLRSKKSLERSQKPVHKKTGKQEMFRSYTAVIEESETDGDGQNENKDAKRFADIFGVFIDDNNFVHVKPNN